MLTVGWLPIAAAVLFLAWSDARPAPRTARSVPETVAAYLQRVPPTKPMRCCKCRRHPRPTPTPFAVHDAPRDGRPQMKASLDGGRFWSRAT